MGITLNESVCVCIAAYNSANTIARAVTSALQQSHVTEVLVVDDASRDATVEKARGCDDGSGRLSVIAMEHNGGPSAARNRALAQSRASLFCVLDSDDYFLHDRIGRLLAADSGAWDFIADDILIVPEELAGTHEAERFDASPIPLTELDIEAFVLSNIVMPGRPRAELGFLKPLMRRSFLDHHGLNYDLTMRLGEDYALYVRALMAGAKFKVVSFCGYIAIERANSLSSSHSAADLNALLAFDETCSEATALSKPVRAALAAHKRSTVDRWALARTLEIRREAGIGHALRFLAQQPHSAAYVASKLVQARSERLRRHFGRDGQTRHARQLIGEKVVGVD